MYTLNDPIPQNAVIKVIGVGGGGGNAVRHMIEQNIEGVDFIVANTDLQALDDLQSATVIQIGAHLTKGLGAGANPTIGKQAAMEDREVISKALKGADMVFITAGMGGGTGSGAAPEIASIAKELGILTVAVVTKPFQFEGKKRNNVANEWTERLQDTVDSLIAIPNARLQSVLGKVSIQEAFAKANDILRGAVQGIADVIIQKGIINVDFADVRTVMSENGMAMMGSGIAMGEERAATATNMAIHSDLLDNITLSEAKGVLVNITVNSDLGIDEYTVIGEMIQDIASENATVVIGTAINPTLQDDELRVTVIATGLEAQQHLETIKQPEVKPAIFSNNQPADLKNRASSDNKRIGSANMFEGFDMQPVIRSQAAESQIVEKQEAQNVESNETFRNGRDSNNRHDFLDIPAFLRKAAD